MFANVLVVAILLVWTLVAITFVVKTTKASMASQNPGCAGCSQGCLLNGSKRCKR